MQCLETIHRLGLVKCCLVCVKNGGAGAEILEKRNCNARSEPWEIETAEQKGGGAETVSDC